VHLFDLSGGLNDFVMDDEVEAVSAPAPATLQRTTIEVKKGKPKGGLPCME
jgi:hypothetical protein